MELKQIQLDYRAKWIIEADEHGMSQQDIAEIFNLTRQRVYQIINNLRATKLRK